MFAFPPAFLMILLLNSVAHAQSSECQPVVMQTLATKTAEVQAFSQKVQTHRNQFPDSKLKAPSDRITYCLSPEGRRKSAMIAQEGMALRDELSAFASSQSGGCQQSAFAASNDVSSNISMLVQMTKTDCTVK